MIKLVPSWVYWLAIAVLTAALGAQHLTHKAKVADMRTNYAQTLKGISDKATEALTATLKANQANALAVAALDRKYTKEKDDALHENETLRDAVAAGTRRLRIRAICPASGNDLPQAGSTGSVGTETAVELGPETGRAVLDLRAGIIADQQALSYLQDYAATCAR